MLAAGRVAGAVVMSHSCDLDKVHSTRVLVAPLVPIESIHPDQQAGVMAGGNLALMPVPEIPGLGNHFADLRSMTALPIEIAKTCTKAASMSEAGVKNLHGRVTAFFTRLELPQR